MTCSVQRPERPGLCRRNSAKGVFRWKRLLITGQVPLRGEIDVHGAKNSSLPLLAATVLCHGETGAPQLPGAFRRDRPPARFFRT